MRVLLDECLPRGLKRLLTGHQCSTVQEVGWSGRTNGELLSLADGKFDVLVTIDQGLQYQQAQHGRSMSVVVIEAASNKIEDLSPVVPNILSALQSIPLGQLRRVSR